MLHIITPESAEQEINSVIKTKMTSNYFVIFILKLFFQMNFYPIELVCTIFFNYYESVKLECRNDYIIIRTDQLHVFSTKCPVNSKLFNNFKNYDPIMYDKQIFFVNDKKIISLGSDDCVYLWKQNSFEKIIHKCIARNVRCIDIPKNKDRFLLYILYNNSELYHSANLKYWWRAHNNVKSMECGFDGVTYVTSDNKILTSNHYGHNNLIYFLTNESKLYCHVSDDISEIKISGKKIIDLKCGILHTIALTADEDVYYWGFDIFGNRDENISTDIPIKVKVKVKNIVSIYSGSFFSILLSKFGYAYYFYRNIF